MIVVGPAIELIVPGFAEEQISAGSATDGIVASSAEEQIVPIVAVDDAVIPTAKDTIPARRAVQRFSGNSTNLRAGGSRAEVCDPL